MTKKSEISRESSEDDEETRVRKFAKHMLKSCLFIGTFMEKRFVEPLNSYRDVIKIADDEKEVIENLKAVKKRCVNYYSKDLWIGITGPKTVGAPAGYNLWVILDEEVFGSYWYKIKNVEFYFNEVRVKLEIVRAVCREKTPPHNITTQEDLEDFHKIDFKELGNKLKRSMLKNLKELFSETITWRNIKNAAIFLFLLVFTMITFLIQGVQYLLDYFLKLLREISGLIKVCTPIIVNFMKLVLNIINGFYALIADMWRTRSPPEIHQNLFQISPFEATNYNAVNYNIRALPYKNENFTRNRRSYGSALKITPLD